MILMTSERTPRRSRRRLSAALGLACMLFLSSCAAGGGPGGGGDASGSDDDGPAKFDDKSTMATIQKRGNLIVGITYDGSSFAYKDPATGSPAGFDVELARAIAKVIFGSQIDGKVQFIELDNRDRERALQQNRVDIALGRYQITVARKRFVDFAGPYFTSYQQVLRESGNDSPIRNLSDLAGKKVCTIRGSTDVEALKAAAPGVDASMVKDNGAQCANELQGGTVTAIVADHIEILPIVSRLSQSAKSYEPIEAHFDLTPYGIGVPKDQTDMRRFLNDLQENQIHQKWDDIYSATVNGSTTEDQQPAVDRY
jgi:glutamate transport system substrate-binding protein